MSDVRIGSKDYKIDKVFIIDANGDYINEQSFTDIKPESIAIATISGTPIAFPRHSSNNYYIVSLSIDFICLALLYKYEDDAKDFIKTFRRG